MASLTFLLDRRFERQPCSRMYSHFRSATFVTFAHCPKWRADKHLSIVLRGVCIFVSDYCLFLYRISWHLLRQRYARIPSVHFWRIFDYHIFFFLESDDVFIPLLVNDDDDENLLNSLSTVDDTPTRLMRSTVETTTVSYDYVESSAKVSISLSS
jgi:hypothetical protein